MRNFQNLSIEQMNAVQGGRTVKKYDYNGDGRWDYKEVFDRNGEIKRVVMRF